MKKLYRSKENKIIGGVCGALADYFEIDPTIVRLAYVLLTLLFPSLFLLYIIAWIIIPEGPEDVVCETDSAAKLQVDTRSQAQTASEILCEDTEKVEPGPEGEILSNESGNFTQVLPEAHNSSATPPQKGGAPTDRTREFFGYFFITLGVLALIKKYVPHVWRLPVVFVRTWWPVAIIALGIALIVTGLRGGK
ncbi:MAG: PspC domain-containing protein [Bacillota bacterium]